MRMGSKTVFSLFLVCFSMFFGLAVNAQENNRNEAERALEAFPAAEMGMVRHVILVEEQEDEFLFKVEIMPGRNMLVDCNNHRLIGLLEERDLEGWGYNYYVFSSDGQIRSTLMACDDPKVEKFIYAPTSIVRYNSRLPIVVYAPEGYEIHYRIWSADTNIRNAVIK